MSYEAKVILRRMSSCVCLLRLVHCIIMPYQAIPMQTNSIGIFLRQDTRFILLSAHFEKVFISCAMELTLISTPYQPMEHYNGLMETMFGRKLSVRMEIEEIKNPSDCDYFQDSLLKNVLCKHSQGKMHASDGDVDLIIILQEEEPTGRLVIGNLTSEKHKCLSQLASVCRGSNNVTGIFDLNFISVEGQIPEMEIVEVGEGHGIKDIMVGNERMVGFDIGFNFDDSCKAAWCEVDDFECIKFRMRLRLTHDAVEQLHLNSVKEPSTIFKNTLAEAPFSDCAIIAENGAEIKCHKVFLSAHSPVFKAMFESRLKEGGNNIVEIPEMTEEAVRAMLSFLYCWEIIEASKCCSIAFQLTVAADKYSIPRLADSIRQLILAKDNAWFNVSVALQLFHFAGTKCELVGEGDEKEQKHYSTLFDKASLALKSKYSKDLEDCPEYQELFQKNPKLAMKLCTYFIVNKY